jgi:hypothetical protein
MGEGRKASDLKFRAGRNSNDAIRVESFGLYGIGSSSSDDAAPSQTRVSVSKMLISRERKDDLKHPKGLGIISSCERLHSNGCLLLSSAK